MALEIEGKIKLISEKQTFNKGFEKQEFVVTTKEQYPQDIKLECTMDKIALLKGYSVGDDIKVSFNLRGNEYNGRYFVNVQAWKIEKAGGSPSMNEAPLPNAIPASENKKEEDDFNDLPF